MGSSTYRLDMDYLLVCIVSRQSGVSVPLKKRKKKASFKKFLIQLKYNSMCLARYVWMFGESSFIESIFRVIPYKLT